MKCLYNLQIILNLIYFSVVCHIFLRVLYPTCLAITLEMNMREFLHLKIFIQ